MWLFLSFIFLIFVMIITIPVVLILSLYAIPYLYKNDKYAYDLDGQDFVNLTPQWLSNWLDEKPNSNTTSNDNEPDIGGNRPYDYLISSEEIEKYEKTLEEKKKYSELTLGEVVVLRGMARSLDLNKDVVDHIDRLQLIRCLFAHCRNRDEWMEKYRDENK